MIGFGAWIWHHDGLVVLLQLIVWALCVVGAGPSIVGWLREQPKWFGPALLTLGAVAAGISLWVVPSLERFQALGHEASYFDCYIGAAEPGNDVGWEPYVTYPLIRWIYWALGRVLPGDTAAVPLVFNALARGAGVVAVGGIGAILGKRPSVGITAAAILALHSVHAFWGGGLYNVPLPFTLGLLCVFLGLRAWRTGETRVLLAAAASGSLVVAGRVEWGLLAPALAVLLLGLDARWGRSDRVKRLGFWAAPLTLAALYAVTLFSGEGQLTEQGGYHGVRGYFETLAHQIWILDVFEPLDHPAALVGALAGALSWWKRGDVGPWGPVGLIGFAVVSWCGIATFNDASYRHALLPGVALVLGLALLAPALRGGGAGALAAIALLLLTGAGELSELRVTAQRYYMSQEAFVADHPGFQADELDGEELEASGCYLITDDERLWNLGIAGSHFNLMDPGEAVKRWRHHHGCIRWLYDAANHRQDGLAARIRGRKLHRWFRWEELGWVRLDGGLEAVVYGMTEPPWGVADSEPIPPTDILMPWETEPE